MTTVSITLLRDVTEIIRPPRALSVPFRFGYPLGKPDDPILQHQVIAAALLLLQRDDVPLIEEFVLEGSDRMR
jgi:hypothetical protein